MKEQKSRTESGTRPDYNITRMGKNVMWMVMPTCQAEEEYA
jgi:hypothetical protein